MRTADASLPPARAARYIIAVPLVLGAILFLSLLLWLQGSSKRKGASQLTNVALGSLAVGAVVLLSVRSGVPWLGIVTALLWTVWQKFGPKWGVRQGARKANPEGRFPRRAARMTREEALEVLGLGNGAGPDEILAEYRRLMKKVHPDLGGTTYLATRLNEAKDVLLGS